jgi:hypothetical protein
VNKDQFVYEATRDGAATRKESRPPRMGVSDPECPMDMALDNARAAGLAAEPAYARYRYEARQRRAVWVFSASAQPAAKPEKTLDGASCAILRD